MVHPPGPVDQAAPRLPHACPALPQGSGPEIDLERVSISLFAPLPQTLIVNQAPKMGQIPCRGCGEPFTPSDPNKVYCSAKCFSTVRKAA